MSTELREHSLVVFVYDGDGRAIPDAAISVAIEGTEIARATTKGFSNAPVRLHFSPNVTALTITVSVGNTKQTQTIDATTGTCTFTFRDVHMGPTPDHTPNVPTWMPIVGVVFSAITLLFFMALVLIAVMTGRTPPPDAKYLVVITLSFCAAFSTLGLASIAAHGSLPGEIGKNNPVRFAAVGSIAAFIVVFILANFYYPDKADAAPNPAATSENSNAADIEIVILEDASKSFAKDTVLNTAYPVDYDVYFDKLLIAQVDNGAVDKGVWARVPNQSAGTHTLTIKSKYGHSDTCELAIEPATSIYVITDASDILSSCKAAPMTKQARDAFLKRTERPQ